MIGEAILPMSGIFTLLIDRGTTRQMIGDGTQPLSGEVTLPNTGNATLLITRKDYLPMSGVSTSPMLW